MKPFITTAGKVDGKVRLRNLKQFEQWVSQLKDGQELIVTFDRAHATRSLDANALYWAGYVTPLSECTGYTPLEMHEYLKRRFLPRTRVLIQDKHGVVIDDDEIGALTTTRLNKVEFSEYLQEIKAFALDLGVDVGSNREAA